MFTTDPDPNQLRQGDVCKIPFVPYWNLRDHDLSRDQDGNISRLELPVLKKVRHKDDAPLVAVCSQCCDIAQPKGRSGIAVAPVRPIPVSARDIEQLEAVKASGTPNEAGEWSWFYIFPVELPSDEGEPEWMMVDTSAIFTVGPMPDAADLLRGSKWLEMTVETRDQFRTKLGVSFGRRPIEDAIELGLAPPLADEAEPAAD